MAVAGTIASQAIRDRELIESVYSGQQTTGTIGHSTGTLRATLGTDGTTIVPTVPKAHRAHHWDVYSSSRQCRADDGHHTGTTRRSHRPIHREAGIVGGGSTPSTTGAQGYM